MEGLGEEGVGRVLDDIFKFFPSNRVISIYHFGSSVSSKNFRDIDIHIILDKYDKEDVARLKGLQNIDDLYDFSIRWNDTTSVDRTNYRHGNQGSYMWDCFAAAKLLYGARSYVADGYLLDSQKKDLMSKIDDYFFRFDNAYYRFSDIDFSKFASKYTFRISIDYLLLEDKCDFYDIHNNSKHTNLDRIYNSGILSKSDLELVVKYIDNPSKREYPIIRDVLYRKYLSFRELLNF